MKRLVTPIPGFSKNTVLPIPTPTLVPWDTVSKGLKYISLFLLDSDVVTIPALIVITRGWTVAIEVTVCRDPTVPSIALNALILLNPFSTFKTLILSVPTPRISFSLIKSKLPFKLKNVIIPVLDVFCTETVVVPIPDKENVVVVIPAL